MRLLDRVSTWSTGLIVSVAFLAAVVLLGLAQIYPYRPRTATGWLLFVVGVPVAWVVSELVADLLDREPAGQWVDGRTANKPFSWVRVSYLLLRTLIVLAFIMFMIWCGATYAPALRDFVVGHFGR